MTIKPYIFNNYEETLPHQPRGFYKSYPVNNILSDKNLEKRDGILLTVDLTDVKTKKEVCERFYIKLGFAKRDGTASWDALGDYLWFFPESSSVFREISPEVVHLRVLNVNHVWKLSESDFGILCEILLTASDNSRFHDNLRIIIEAINES